MARYEVDAIAEALRVSPLVLALASDEVAALAEKIVDDLHRQDLRLTSTGGPSCDD